MGPSWVVLGASWAVLGLSWAVLGPSWGPLGPSCGDLEGLLGRLGASGSGKGEKAKNIEKYNGKSMFLASRGPLGGLLRRLGGLLARLGAILGVLEHLGAIFRPLGALLERLGGLLGLSWRLRGPQGCVGELVPPPSNRILDPRGGGKGEGDSQMSHTPFHPRQAGVGGLRRTSSVASRVLNGVCPAL